MTTTVAELRANAHGARASQNSALAKIFDECAETLELSERALEHMTESANEEGIRATKAEHEVRELRAALERARALLKRIEWQDATTRPIYCDIVVCVACGRDHPNHKPDCELSALLVLAGEARP